MEDARKVLRALADRRFTFRTRTGISQDTGISKDVVNKVLDDLVTRGLARKVRVRIDGEPKIRWSLSERGRALMTGAE